MAKKRKNSKHTLETAPPAPKSGGKSAWRLMDRGSAVVAGLLAQRISALAWRAVTGKNPPISGRHPEVSTGEAIAWAAIGGGLIELVKVGVRRGTATYWVRSTGNLPPGMKPIGGGPGNEKEPIPKEPAPERSSTKKVSRRNRGR